MGRRKAAVEDSSGAEIASDRSLWFNLLDAAEMLRERLSTDPKWSFLLKPGCCERDPGFKHSVEVRRERGLVCLGGVCVCGLTVVVVEVWYGVEAFFAGSGSAVRGRLCCSGFGRRYGV